VSTKPLTAMIWSIENSIGMVGRVDLFQTTRREFVQLFTSTAAVAALGGISPLWSEALTSPRPVKAWLTSDSRRFAAVEGPKWITAVSQESVHIDPATWYQEILGFGGAFTDASCYLFYQLSPQDRKALFDELFGPSGLRFSMGRVCIGSSDYTTSIYSFDESSEPDPELKHFSIEHDRAYILPSLRLAREINPALFLFSAPWSPPAWMKPNRSMLGGSMEKTYFDSYAQYFVRFLQGYAAEGVSISATTIQNEIDTNQVSRMPACVWSQEDAENFVANHLGPALVRASLDTKIWLLDHNYDLWGRVLDELSDPAVNRYVDSVAWHAYKGTVDAMTRVHDAFPNKHAQWTEGGAVITSPDFETDWSRWAATFAGVLKNWGCSIVGWNLALDEEGKPNMGPGQSGGIVTIHSKTQKITRCGQYWAFAHYSKLVQRGARVLASYGELENISHVAVENPDGSYVLVLANQSGLERLVPCSFGSYELQVKLPHNSVATLLW
jgi:glucosylceramidase